MTAAGKKALLLGVGNLLLNDEGIGVRVVEEFDRRYDTPELDIVDGGTAGMELLDDLADRPLVVIVDCIKSKDPVGTVKWLEDEQVPKFFSRKLSPHQLGLSDVLSALIMTGEYPARLRLLGAVPESIDTEIGLTDLLAGRKEEMVEQLRAFFSEEGFEVKEGTYCTMKLGI
ncbi:hydrogenase maturation protease [Desulforhopalus vacuolatus]|uniref:hydrogenase maturation protease n=1 Tax=Desulforhopalus vacuolatus TaxID=40414 RepID=UPI0019662042|nr:hydrogenase maturation protease [Desulforhopalus vacuolatus]MBM9519916.1 hydrogenase maturation protease [Desulforhopalus vacuolatus]